MPIHSQQIWPGATDVLVIVEVTIGFEKVSLLRIPGKTVTNNPVWEGWPNQNTDDDAHQQASDPFRKPRPDLIRARN